MVSRNRKIARRIGQAVANDVLDISGAISAGAGVTVYATADDLPTTGLTAGDEAFISGSNRLYISNGTGWYSIGLINTNPAITSVQDPSANTTPFTLATDGSALVLTVTAADPEDVPLTYSYAVTTGSLTNGGGTTATVAQGNGEGYAIASASILSGTYTIGAYLAALTFKPDGTKMYTISTNTDRVSQYDLSTAWDLSTATYDDNFSVQSQVLNLTDVKFNTDGTKMFVADRAGTTDNTIYQYSLSTAWDITTATYANKSYDFSAVLTSDELSCFVFNNDGSAVYLTELGPDRSVFQFTLSTPFDISTASYSNKSLSLSSVASNSYIGRQYFQFTNDGTKLFLIHTFHPAGFVGKIYEFSLTTAYDISTASYTNVNYTPSGITTGRSAIAFKPDGSKMFILGTDNHTTISQFNLPIYSANQFIITPTATEAYAGTFELTFTASDGINQASSVNSFTLSFITNIANSNYTTLLATATGTSDNNNITDASTNNHSITVNGDTQVGTFSPYRSGGYSTYFDGTGDYLQLSSVLPEGAFTASCWAYFNTSTNDAVFSQGTSGNSRRTRLVNVGSYLGFWIGSTSVQSSSGSIVPKTWYYIEVQYNGSQIELFINGTSVGTTSNTSNPQNTNFHVGSLGSSWSTSNDLDGYVSDLKVVSGTPSGSSTVPTDPLLSSGSALHICHLPYIADGSSNAHSITLNGNTSTKPFSPYDYLEYSATDHGGSVFIEANGGHLSGTLSSGGLGTTFTVEMWIYDDGTGGATPYGGYFTTTDLSSQYGIQLRRYGAYIFNSTTGTNLTWAANGDPFATVFGVGWHHVAAVHNGSTFKVYVDGKEIISTSDSHTYSSVNYKVGYPWLYLSNHPDQQAQAYISDLRINKSVIYSGEFTPPTAPLSSTGAELHIKGTDASIIDKSQVNNIKMNGPTTGSTTKTFVVSEPTISFASGSNSSRYLEFDPTVLDFMEILGDPSIPFTIEGIWGWQGSTASPIFEIFQDTNNFFYFGGGPGGTQSGITTDNNLYAIFKIGGVERFKMTAGIGSYNNVGSSFKHQAITRNSSGLMQHYYDGQLRSNTITHSGSDTVSWTSPVGYIGRSDWMGIYGRYEGYIHQVRLTVGLARYTANFTPPTASLEG